MNYSQPFTLLTDQLENFLKEFHSRKSSLMVTDQWTVKDILCHIVFWHERYAENYKSGIVPELPPSKLNIPGVKSLRKYSAKVLISRLYAAHAILKKYIVDQRVPRMTYHKKGRIYQTEEFLVGIAHHLHHHASAIHRAK